MWRIPRVSPDESVLSSPLHRSDSWRRFARRGARWSEARTEGQPALGSRGIGAGILCNGGRAKGQLPRGEIPRIVLPRIGSEWLVSWRFLVEPLDTSGWALQWLSSSWAAPGHRLVDTLRSTPTGPNSQANRCQLRQFRLSRSGSSIAAPMSALGKRRLMGVAHALR